MLFAVLAVATVAAVPVPIPATVPAIFPTAVTPANLALTNAPGLVTGGLCGLRFRGSVDVVSNEPDFTAQRATRSVHRSYSGTSESNDVCCCSFRRSEGNDNTIEGSILPTGQPTGQPSTFSIVKCATGALPCIGL